MYKRHLSLLTVTLFSALASATPVPIGFLSFDQAIGTAGVFDITNQTGPNASSFPDTTFPALTPITFSNLSLLVNFLGGGATTLGPSNFIPDGSGGFTGNSIFSLGSFPIASAILSGSFSATTLSLNNGSSVPILSSFSSTVLPSSGTSLQFGDFGFIEAQATPEPASLLFLGSGLAGLLLLRKKRLGMALSVALRTAAPVFALIACAVLAQSTVSAQVTLNGAAQPPTGNAGVTIENVSGSGFPAGAIAPATLTVSLAPTCNAPATGTATASSVTTLAGSFRRVSFTIPAATPAGTYAVSVSGTSDSGAAFSTASCSSLTVQPADKFVRSVNGTLMFNGFPFRFGGTNVYQLMFSSHTVVDQVLQTAVDDHLKVIRMWAFDDIGVPGPNDTFYLQSFNGGAPAFNDGPNGLANVDYAVMKAGQLGIKLIMPFVNNWPEYGGMNQYVAWRGGRFHDEFYTDPLIRQWYKNWINHLLTHVNTITGVAYKDDPTIMIWELGNEPRCGGTGLPTSGTCNVSTIVSWIADASAYVKSVDPNHLVAVGDEGFFCDPAAGSDSIANCSSGVDTLAFSEIPSIDLMGFHMYPEGWGKDQAWSENYVDQHLALAAHTVGKPAYMGEFGMLAGNLRNFLYKDWTDRVLNDGGSGGLFWNLSPGLPPPSSSEANGALDIRNGSPILITMGNFEQMMAANSVLPFPPVAGDQWGTTSFNQPLTLHPLNNDVAYAGSAVDPNSIDLDPDTPGQQTSLSVFGGTFTVSGSAVEFTPTPGFNGGAQASYTVADSNHKLSNRAYLFVTVKPSQTGSLTIESFETGTGGWGPLTPGGGTVAQTTAFHTDGNNGLVINATSSGWFGVGLPAGLDLSGRPTLSLDIQTTGTGGGTAFAIQSGGSFTWCQTPDPQPVLSTNSTTTVSVSLDPAQLTCFSPNTPDMSQVRAIWVFLAGPGTYYVDFLRAAPKTNAAAGQLLESFETGVDGWASINGKPATLTQSNQFATDGNNSLLVNAPISSSDWFGFNLASRANISGKTKLKVDVTTVEAGTSTAIAIQTGAGFTWCQTANWGFQNAGTSGTVTLNLAADCPTADLTTLDAVWVWVSGGGNFYLDNLRAE